SAPHDSGSHPTPPSHRSAVSSICAAMSSEYRAGCAGGAVTGWRGATLGVSYLLTDEMGARPAWPNLRPARRATCLRGGGVHAHRLEGAGRGAGRAEVQREPVGLDTE